MLYLTPYQKFREKNRESILALMQRMGVTLGRSEIFERILFDLWVVHRARRSLKHFESESWTSRQLSTPLSKNT